MWHWLLRPGCRLPGQGGILGKGLPIASAQLPSPGQPDIAEAQQPARCPLLAMRAERTPHQCITLDFLLYIALSLFGTQQHKFVVNHDRLLS